MTARFEGYLDLRHRDEPVDGKWFKTLTTFSYYSKNGEWYLIPRGVNTDFASIPRAFRWLIPRSGRHTKSCVFHDWLCEFKIVSRKKADRLLLESLKISKNGFLKRRFMYFGVRSYSILTFKK